MLNLKSYVDKVLNEEEGPEGAEGAEGAEGKKPDEKPETAAKKECDTILTVECCGTTLKKIIDAIKKTSGDFKVEIDTGDEEKEMKIEWNGETDMIGAIKAEKKEKAE